MAYSDIRTPEAHAAVLGEADQSIEGSIHYSVAHNAAAQMHGWEAHKLATTEAFTLIEGAYQQALQAAMDGSAPFASALSPYANVANPPAIGPGKNVVSGDSETPWVTFEDLTLPATSTQVFDYVVRVYGYAGSAPTTRVIETALIRVTRDAVGAASLLSSATPFTEARLRVTVGADDITIDVRAHATDTWVWDTEAIRQIAPPPPAIGTTAGTVAAGNDARIGTVTAHLPNGTSQTASGVTAEPGSAVVSGVLRPNRLSLVRRAHFDAEDHFHSRLSHQWRMDPNAITLAGSGVSAVAEKVTGRAANALVQATDAQRPQFSPSHASFGGRSAITDGGSGQGHDKRLACSAAEISLAFPYWRIFIFAPTTTITGADCRLAGSSASREFEIDVAFADQGYFVYNGTGSQANKIGVSTSAPGTAAMLAISVHDQLGKRARAILYTADGKMQVKEQMLLNAIAPGPLCVLNWTINGMGYPGGIADILQGPGSLSPTDEMATIAYCAEWYGFAELQRRVLFDGNSLMVGAEAGLAAMAQASTVHLAHTNVAVSGRSTEAVRAALLYSNADWGVEAQNGLYVCSELTNHINQGATGEQAIAAAIALIADARALGYTNVIFTTCLPRGGLTAGMITARNYANNYLAANWAAMGITKLVNFHTASAIDGQTCPAALLDTLNAIWNVDQTHLVDYTLFVAQIRLRMAEIGFYA